MTNSSSKAVAVLVALTLLGACGDDSSGPVGDAAVNLFPTPVSDATSAFPETDDAFLEVQFTRDFSFEFYGTTYNSIFLNTNGGFTFGGGDADFDVTASGVAQPGVGVFWGDMDAGLAPNRGNQMSYRQFDDRFVITYSRLQDHDEPGWDNSATVTLRQDGTITIAYGTVGSQDILVGIWDGTHTDDRRLAVQNAFANYTDTGTGILLYDFHETDVPHTGTLNGRTITFSP